MERLTFDDDEIEIIYKAVEYLGHIANEQKTGKIWELYS